MSVSPYGRSCFSLCPHRDSNSDLQLRRLPFFPLHYGNVSSTMPGRLPSYRGSGPNHAAGGSSAAASFAGSLVGREGIEPPFATCKDALLPLKLTTQARLCFHYTMHRLSPSHRGSNPGLPLSAPLENRTPVNRLSSGRSTTELEAQGHRISGHHGGRQPPDSPWRRPHVGAPELGPICGRPSQKGSSAVRLTKS